MSERASSKRFYLNSKNNVYYYFSFDLVKSYLINFYGEEFGKQLSEILLHVADTCSKLPIHQLLGLALYVCHKLHQNLINNIKADLKNSCMTRTSLLEINKMIRLLETASSINLTTGHI